MAEIISLEEALQMDPSSLSTPQSQKNDDSVIWESQTCIEAAHKPSNNSDEWLSLFYHPFLNLTPPFHLSQSTLLAHCQNSLYINAYQGTKFKYFLQVDDPSAVVSLCIDETSGNDLTIVSSANSLFVYSTCSDTLIFKYEIPSLPPSEHERNVYDIFMNTSSESNHDNIDTLLDSLRVLSHEIILSPFSRHILNAPDCKFLSDTFRLEWIDTPSLITCMTTIKKTEPEDRKVGYLVIGTETNRVLILDIKSLKQLKEFIFTSPPYLITIEGYFDMDYKMFVLCRDNSIYRVSNLEYQILTHLDEVPIDMCIHSRYLIVAVPSNGVFCFDCQGKLQRTISNESQVTFVKSLRIDARNLSLLAIGYSNNQILFYDSHWNISLQLETRELPIECEFGDYAGEKNCLLVLGSNGGLSAHMIKRSALLSLGLKFKGKAPPSVQNLPLNLQPRTRLFINERQRQKQDTRIIHGLFQRDLAQLGSLVDDFHEKLQVGDGIDGSQVSLTYEVIGLGPLYKIVLNVHLTNSNNDFQEGYSLILTSDCSQIITFPSIIHLPLLLPERILTVHFMVKIPPTVDDILKSQIMSDWRDEDDEYFVHANLIRNQKVQAICSIDFPSSSSQ